MQSHTASWLHADWSLASTDPYLASHQPLYLHLPLLSMSTITVINSGISFIVLIPCNCFSCSNVNNAQQKTKHDGQAVWYACVCAFPPGWSVEDTVMRGSVQCDSSIWMNTQSQNTAENQCTTGKETDFLLHAMAAE